MTDDTTGFATQSVCAPLCVNKKILGVIEVLNKRDGTPFGEHDLESVVSVANTAAMTIENTRLYQNLIEAYRNTLEAATAAVDSRVPFTRGHSQRVMEYAVKAGMILSFNAEEMEILEYAGLLHDVGKFNIDLAILNKTGQLSVDEAEIIQNHPVFGAELISGVPFLEKARPLVLYHHERYDGKGYPEGLKGEDIPMGARLIAVANEYDILTNDAYQRPALPIEDAVKTIRDAAGTQFCPVAVKALMSGLRLNTLKQ